MPKTSKLRPEEKEEKPMGPFKRMINGYRLCVTFHKCPNKPYFDTTEAWMKLNERSIMAMGYMPSEGYKTVNKNWGTTYVKFVGFEKHPIYRYVKPDGIEQPAELVEIKTRQTATTLCDYAVSDALNKFMDSMRVKKPMSNGSWGLIGMAAIIVVALIGGYLYMTGRA